MPSLVGWWNGEAEILKERIFQPALPNVPPTASADRNIPFIILSRACSPVKILSCIDLYYSLADIC